MINIDNLFKMISEKGITQSKLAENTSISTGNISDWKKGRSMPTAVKLDELATYFGCSVDYLLGRTDTPNEYNNNQINNSNNIAFGKNSSVNVGSGEIEKEICNILNSLNLRERSELLTIIYQFCDKCKNKETL